jgi:pimeloyl-ACP methyl ester carboxylesterase
MIPTVRLAQHSLTLCDGHQVRAMVAGHGMPLVVVHGFAADGLLYAQSLSRLVSMGFKVVAIDTAGHGGTAVLPRDGLQLSAYSRLLGHAVDELGIRQAVFLGHSMGGRLVAELASQDPSRVVALLLVNAIVGDTWDRIVTACRLWPPLLSVFGTAALIDSMNNVSLDDPRQTAKLASLMTRTMVGDLSRPWQLLNPALSVLRSRHSAPLLDRLREHGVPVTVIHGDHDYVVPVHSARDAARRTGGDLVTVLGGSHSWLLKDPETLPAIMGTLLRGSLGEAYDAALIRAGLEPGSATTAEIEAAFYEPDARACRFTPELTFARSNRRSAPRYRFRIDPGAGSPTPRIDQSSSSIG